MVCPGLSKFGHLADKGGRGGVDFFDFVRASFMDGSLCFCLFCALAPIFTSNSAVFVGGSAKILFVPEAGILAMYCSCYECHFYVIMALLRHRQIKLIEGRGKSINHGTDITEIV